MPRTKLNNSAGLGKSIINRKAKEAKISPQSQKYSEDQENLSSVTHEKDLDEFLNSAALAETDFTAERTNIKVVSAPSIPTAVRNPYLLTTREEASIAKKQAEQKQGLRVPRRPGWDEETTRADLERMERETFLEWRRGLAALAETHGLLLTPFERNLQVWRQLWRVIERSHLVVQIVDGRNPNSFRCQDLEAYVSEVGVIGAEAGTEVGSTTTAGNRNRAGLRRSLLLINKSDLLTKKQRRAWADYFDSQNVTYAFFSALSSTALQEQAEKQRRRAAGEEEDEREDREGREEEEEEDEEEDDTIKEEEEDEDEDLEDDEDWEDDAELLEGDEQEDVEAAIAQQLAATRIAAEETPAPEPVTVAPDVALDADAEGGPLMVAQPEPRVDSTASGSTDATAANAAGDDDSDSELEDEETEDEDPRIKVLSVLELEALFERVAPPVSAFATARNPNPTKLMVGLVGYPNVGKSSTINALLGEKKVSVSSTPGKTKHFQTLAFSDSITLCDCPGLVFPQFVNTQADMVCDGVLPIDQMREASAPVELLCRRIPREILEGTYGIRIDVTEIEDGGTGKVGWEDLLSTYAIARGLTRASFGMPDTSRAARYILKDYVNARLVYCHPPTGVDPDAFMKGSRALSIKRIEAEEAAGKKKAPVTRVGKGADTFVNAAGPAVPANADVVGTEEQEQEKERARQATSQSIRQSAASAPARSGARGKGIDNDFFLDVGPSPRPVAKGVVGAGLEGGYSRTKMYPHTQAIGNDGLPVQVSGAPMAREIHAMAGRTEKNSKRHFKIKDGKKRSGKGYD